MAYVNNYVDLYVNAHSFPCYPSYCRLLKKNTTIKNCKPCEYPGRFSPNPVCPIRCFTLILIRPGRFAPMFNSKCKYIL